MIEYGLANATIKGQIGLKKCNERGVKKENGKHEQKSDKTLSILAESQMRKVEGNDEKSMQGRRREAEWDN